MSRRDTITREERWAHSSSRAPGRSTRDVPPPSPKASIKERPPRRRRSTLVLLALGLVVTGALFGGRWLLHAPYLRVQHVTLVGLRHESAASVLVATGLDDHPPMIDVTNASVEKGLAAFPWIDKVSVTRHWPNTVVVEVHETTAVAVAFDAEHQLRYVSPRGRDLGPAPTDANLPTLVYARKSSTWPFARVARPGAYVASQLPPAFSSQVSVITVDRDGDVSLALTTPVTFDLGTDVELQAKFVAIASVIAHSTLVPGDVVDVSVPDELAVTPPTHS